MKLNVYTYILALLGVSSAIIISNILGQGILGVILAIIFLVLAVDTTKPKKRDAGEYRALM